ncbi:zf-CSL-domain-containing protein [Coprinopsis sp. MPI-PUGE-AT-0042]|nr:zf-CSL-domain-containing protein [Coprinopsis sp. MPI-PUGE-AT-0042]
MGAYYDEIEIEDMAWDDEKKVFHYPCPCGDRFEISRKQLKDYEDVATCPSCSLIIRVIFDPLDFEDDPSDDEEGESAEDEEEDEEDASDSDEAFEDALDKLTLEDKPEPASKTAATLVSAVAA